MLPLIQFVPYKYTIRLFYYFYDFLGVAIFKHKLSKEKKLENQFIGALKSISFCFPIKLCFKGHKWRVIVCHLRFYGSLVRAQITIRCVVDFRLWKKKREKNQHFCEKTQKKPSGESRPIHGDSQVFARWVGFSDPVDRNSEFSTSKSSQLSGRKRNFFPFRKVLKNFNLFPFMHFI